MNDIKRISSYLAFTLLGVALTLSIFDSVNLLYVGFLLTLVMVLLIFSYENVKDLYHYGIELCFCTLAFGAFNLNGYVFAAVVCSSVTGIIAIGIKMLIDYLGNDTS